MSSRNPIWREIYPPIIADLLIVIARAHKQPPKRDRYMRMARWGAERAATAIATGMQKRGYQVKHHGRKFTDAGYIRIQLPAVVATDGKDTISVEFADKKPENAPIRRLAKGEGTRILVLTEAGSYRPWDPADKTSEFHRIPPESLANVDYLIAGRSDNMMCIGREDLARSYYKRDIDTLTVLELIDQAWQREYPLSSHGRVFEYEGQQTRYIPQLLWELFEIHPKVSKRKIMELRRQGLVTHGKHHRNWLKGYKLTEKGAQELKKKTQG